MESALARFVTTGRVSFSGFVDSVIADLARLATRRYITQPLGDLLFGALGGGATPGSAVFGRLQAGVGHAGAVAGQPGGVRRAVPPAVFAFAPRFHEGGIAGLRPDEVPIIAQAGEVILPRASGATLPRGAALAPSIEINFENRGTPQREVSREVRLDPRGLIVTVVTDDIRRGGPARPCNASSAEDSHDARAGPRSGSERATARRAERRVAKRAGEARRLREKNVSAGGLVWPLRGGRGGRLRRHRR